MPNQPITVTPGNPQSAGWCSSCGLPSLVTVCLYTMTDDGPMPLGSWTGCVEDACEADVDR